MNEVVLHVYDLSNGLAKTMSQSFLGKQIDGVWHTGVVVFGKEFFFGGGIQHDEPGRTPYGTPVDKIPLGDSHIPEDVFVEFLQEISGRFSAETYDLLHNNCNNFTNECCVFLTGAPIPEYITSLPSEVLNTPLGPMIESMMRGMHQQGPPVPGALPPGGLAAMNPNAFGALPMGGASGAGQHGAPSHTPPGTSRTAGTSDEVQGGAEGGHSSTSSLQVGIAAPTRSHRPHVHEELDAVLCTLMSFSKPLLLADKGDNGAAAMARLRALVEAQHADGSTTTTPQVPAQEIEALAAIEALLQLPLDAPEAQTASLPKDAYRFLARVLARWPLPSWGPALDLMRLMLLYPAVARHYAGTKSSHCNIVVKRCLCKAAGSADVPKGVRLRALFMIINVFAHACGVHKMMRPGGTADLIDACLDMLSVADATIRMSAAAVLFNISLYLPKVACLGTRHCTHALPHPGLACDGLRSRCLYAARVVWQFGMPKGASMPACTGASTHAGNPVTCLVFDCLVCQVEGVELVQISTGAAHHLGAEGSDLDDETAFRLLMALGRLAYCNSSAVQLLRTLNLNLESRESVLADGGAGKNRKAMTAELKALLDARVDP